MFASSGCASLQMCGGRCQQPILRLAVKGDTYGGRGYLMGSPGDSSTNVFIVYRSQEVVCASHEWILRLV
jgi:hypothetical protein